jgi:hypothetical protein
MTNNESLWDQLGSAASISTLKLYSTETMIHEICGSVNAFNKQYADRDFQGLFKLI